MRQRFVTSQWVPYPLEVVFGFFANPNNLPLLTPEPLKMRIDDMKLVQAPAPAGTAASLLPAPAIAAGVGTEMKLSFQPAPFVPLRVSWVARITEFAWFDHFCDEQVSGPFAFFRHTHGVQTKTQQGRAGTEVTDEVEFEVPLGPIGALGGGVVRRQMEQMFRTRQERLPQILAAQARKPS
ncbi:SRPBCC family protein [Occallatibacter savannae]|uniref:SRPBCC family protein n=1 Tax=Occallatibacter savannae TaxID=1002691 RepID=UPI0013A53373|nr:SRPBCC family protein [Occallatibacter savannae]